MTQIEIQHKLAPVYRKFADAIENGHITFGEFAKRMRRMLVNIGNACGNECEPEDLREILRAGQAGDELSPALAALLLREIADIFEQD